MLFRYSWDDTPGSEKKVTIPGRFPLIIVVSCGGSRITHDVLRRIIIIVGDFLTKRYSVTIGREKYNGTRNNRVPLRGS